MKGDHEKRVYRFTNWERAVIWVALSDHRARIFEYPEDKLDRTELLEAIDRSMAELEYPT